MLPKNYDPRRPAPLAVRMQGAISTYSVPNRFWSRSNERTMTKALVDAGYIVIASNDGYTVGNDASNRFANNESMANHAEFIETMRSQYAISGVIFFGTSMGGQTALRLLAKRTVPNVLALYLTAAGIDWSDVSDPVYDPGLIASMGVSTREQALAVINDPADPISSILHPAWKFRGVPIRLVSIADDVIAVPSVQHDPFIAKVGQYHTEASKFVIASGGHGTNSQFNPTDMMNFLNKYITF